MKVRFTVNPLIWDTLVGYKIVDRSDVVLLQLHLDSQLNTWLQGIA